MNPKTVARSCIYIDEVVPNTQRRFGQASEYVPAYLVRIGNKPVALLLTQEQIRDAKVRAEGNPEDCPPFESPEQRCGRAVDVALLAEKQSAANERHNDERRHHAALGAIGVIALLLGVGLGVLL